MSSADMLLAYLRGLKPSIQQQVMLTAPATLSNAMYAANAADSKYWFSHQWNKSSPSSHQRGGHGKQDVLYNWVHEWQCRLAEVKRPPLLSPWWSLLSIAMLL